MGVSQGHCACNGLEDVNSSAEIVRSLCRTSGFSASESMPSVVVPANREPFVLATSAGRRARLPVGLTVSIVEDASCLTIAKIAPSSSVSEWNAIHSEADNVQVGDTITSVNGHSGHALDMQSQLDLLSTSLEIEDLVLEIRPKAPGNAQHYAKVGWQVQSGSWAESKVVDPASSSSSACPNRGEEMYALSLGRSCNHGGMLSMPASDVNGYSNNAGLSNDDMYSVAMARRSMHRDQADSPGGCHMPHKIASYDGSPLRTKMTCYEGIDLQAAAAEMAAADSTKAAADACSSDRMSMASNAASNLSGAPSMPLLAAVAPVVVDVKMPMAGEPLSLPCRRSAAPQPKRKLNKPISA